MPSYQSSHAGCCGSMCRSLSSLEIVQNDQVQIWLIHDVMDIYVYLVLWYCWWMTKSVKRDHHIWSFRVLHVWSNEHTQLCWVYQTTWFSFIVSESNGIHWISVGVRLKCCRLSAGWFHLVRFRSWGIVQSRRYLWYSCINVSPQDTYHIVVRWWTLFWTWSNEVFMETSCFRLSFDSLWNVFMCESDMHWSIVQYYVLI